MGGTLALLGGEPTITQTSGEWFRWPILEAADEAAVLAALRSPAAGDDLIAAFEGEFGQWLGAPFVLAEASGTNALLAALFACGVGVGDEVIVPACTYWATASPVMSLRATPVFADVQRATFNICPEDIRRKLSKRTRAIVVTHVFGHPCDMRAITAIARENGVKVIEDAAHAMGSLYEGRKAGVLGDVGAFSLAQKGLATGGGGLLVTRDRDTYERAIAWGHSERFYPPVVESEDLLRFAGAPLGGVTSRMHVLSAALSRVQLESFDERMAEVDAAMSYFWDLLEGAPGFRSHRPSKESGSTMGAWYSPHGTYVGAELSGLSLRRCVEALCAEGVDTWTWGGLSKPLHLHPVFQIADVYREGRPTSIAHADRDARAARGTLPVAESIEALAVPAFKRYDREAIELHVRAFEKLIARHKDLLVES